MVWGLVLWWGSIAKRNTTEKTKRSKRVHPARHPGPRWPRNGLLWNFLRANSGRESRSVKYNICLPPLAGENGQLLTIFPGEAGQRAIYHPLLPPSVIAGPGGRPSTALSCPSPAIAGPRVRSPTGRCANRRQGGRGRVTNRMLCWLSDVTPAPNIFGNDPAPKPVIVLQSVR